MTRSLPLAAVLAVVLHVAAPAMASGGTGKVLVTDLNKGKIDVYDPNTNDWKLFTLLRKVGRAPAPPRPRPLAAPGRHARVRPTPAFEV